VYSNSAAAAGEKLVYDCEINVIKASKDITQNPASTSTSNKDSSELYTEAAKRFAPIIYLDNKEKYSFSSVDYYLNSSKLYDRTNQIIKNANDGDLPSDGDSNYIHVDENLQTKFYLRSISDAKVYVNIKSYGSTVSPPCVDFQYWFFYPISGPVIAHFELSGQLDYEKIAEFAASKATSISPQLAAAKQGFDIAKAGLKKVGADKVLEKESQKLGINKLESKLETITKKFEIDLNPLGKCEGDWQHITIRVDANLSKIIGVYYPQFSSGKKVISQFLSSTVKIENGHPVIFSSRIGHASYFSEGENLSESKKEGVDTEYAKFRFTFGIINSCAKGTKFDSSDKLEIINAVDLSNNSPLFPLKTPSWLNYRGRWGKSDIVALTDQFKPITEFLHKVPGPIVKEVQTKFESMIPQSFTNILSSPSPKYMDSFNKNEFA